MKVFVVKLFICVLKILYAPLKLRKTENKILWLSRQSDEKSLDMRLLENELKTVLPQAKQVFRLKKLRDESSLSVGYIFSIFGDMLEMSTAKLVITDTYSIPVSCLDHKKELEIIQLWHAAGAVKKFGLQSVGKAQGRDENVSKAMRMHRNYTCVIAPSRATAAFYCEAFGCGEDKVKICCLPRLDFLLDGRSRREEFIELNPQFGGKSIAVYVPTFREGDGEYAQRLRKAFVNAGGVTLAASVHPLSKSAVSDTFNGEFSSAELIKLADFVITDYSACAFEAALLGKRLYFYVPDYNKYSTEQGLNVDLYKEMSSSCFEDETALVNALRDGSYDYAALGAFCDKYIENKNSGNTQRLAEIVKEVFER